MNAISMLKQDHKKVRALFRRFEGARDTSQRRTIAEKVFGELDIHTSLEEEIFYPAVERTDGVKGKDLVGEAIEEHGVAKTLIKELKGLAPASNEYEAKFIVLIENVEHHIEEEEGQMLPLAHTTLSQAQLNELGERMAERQHSLTSPGVIGQTLAHAKTLLAEAVDALTGSMPTKSHASRSSTRPKTGQKTKRQSRKSAAPTKATDKSRRTRTHGRSETRQAVSTGGRKPPRKQAAGAKSRTRAQRGRH